MEDCAFGRGVTHTEITQCGVSVERWTQGHGGSAHPRLQGRFPRLPQGSDAGSERVKDLDRAFKGAGRKREMPGFHAKETTCLNRSVGRMGPGLELR